MAEEMQNYTGQNVPDQEKQGSLIVPLSAPLGGSTQEADSAAQNRERDLRLRTIIDHAPFGAHSYELHEDGRLVLIGFNSSAEKILGVKHSAFVGMTIEEAFPALVSTSIPSEYRKIAATGCSLETDQIMYNEGQIAGAFEIHGFQIGPNQMTVFFRDITERVRAEKALERERKKADEEVHALTASLEQRVKERTAELEVANKELEAFSYSVSHDLRAPLRSIDGFATALEEDCAAQLSEEGLRYLSFVRGGAQRMGALIDDLLRLSRLTRQPLDKERIDMDSLVRSALDEHAPTCSGRVVQFKVDPLQSCVGDQPLLRQVWLNLLSNAIKYTREKSPAVIEIGCRTEQGHTVYWVRDNGAGFDMQYAGKLFRVFQRLHRDDEYEGTGVGLALVQRVLQRHGGRIWVEARPGEGATFHFTTTGEENNERK